MSTYTCDCLTCGDPFTHERMHPMIEPGHCADCLRILGWVWTDRAVIGAMPMRAEEV